MSAVTVNYDKLTFECRSCERLLYNGGPCGGRSGLVNICLAYKRINHVMGNKGDNGIKICDKSCKYSQPYNDECCVCWHKKIKGSNVKMGIDCTVEMLKSENI